MINSKSGRKFSTIVIKLVFILLLLPGLQVTWSATKKETEHFPVPKNLRLRVQFWINVFTRYSRNQYIIHDVEKPERIYRVVDLRDFGDDLIASDADKEKILRENVSEVKHMLKKLAVNDNSVDSLGEEERRMFRLFGKDPRNSVFQHAVKHIRIQRGMKEKFIKGVERSELYVQTFKKIFREEGIPECLIYLVHVESSFNNRAESKYGAVGMWQFTRATGRMYMTINNRVDERKDPYQSCRAAAKLLKRNYEELGSWPLAVTAYNHGLYGVKKAVSKSGSREIDKIIENYSSRIFGFASKNFYAEFMAVVYIIEKFSNNSEITTLFSP